MDIVTRVTHKFGGKVLVDGEILEIGPKGVIQNVPEKAAEKLLQNPSWDLYDPDHENVLPDPIGPNRAKAKMALIGADGEVHEAPPVPEEVKEPAVVQEPVIDENTELQGDGVPPIPQDDAQDDAAIAEGLLMQDAPTEVIEGEPATEDDEDEEAIELAEGDPPIPDGEVEWPDPKEEYSMNWLRACADAYDVKFANNIGPSALVKKITKAMYK